MIEHTQRLPFVMRATTPIAWRNDRAIATKLMGFAATELGSSLDMLRAAERTDDARLRRLYFRHGLDEARHAQRFRDAAKRVHPEAAEQTRAHEKLHARRMDLHEQLGELPFVAFVHSAEARAKAQFEVLEAHFASHDRAELATLFREIGKDEQRHVAYSGAILDGWRAAGRGAEVDRALRQVRLRAAWQGWRRAGRRIGDVMVRVLLILLFVAVLPLFALIQRCARRRDEIGWRHSGTQSFGSQSLGSQSLGSQSSPSSLDELRRQS